MSEYWEGFLDCAYYAATGITVLFGIAMFWVGHTDAKMMREWSKKKEEDSEDEMYKM